MSVLRSIRGQLFKGFVLLIFCSSACADLVVIVNEASAVQSLTKDDVRSIFMGKLFVFPSTSQEVEALDQEKSSQTRADFYKIVCRKSQRKMNSYWARYLFTGKGQPPKSFGDDQSIVAQVSQLPNAIGYIDEQALAPGVKVVYRVVDGK